MPTLTGKPADIIVARCQHCKRETFKLLGKAPAGTKHGDVFVKAPSGYSFIECASCGEQYEFQARK